MGISINAYNITQNSAFLSATWDGYPIDAGHGYTAGIMCNGVQVANQDYSSNTMLSGTIGGLYPNTVYSATVTMWYKDGAIAYNSVSFTTSPSSSIMGQPTINSIYPNGKDAIIYFTNGMNSDYTLLEYKDGNGSFYNTNTVAYSPVSHTFPSYYTTYYVRARGISFSGQQSDWSNSFTFVTGSDPASTRPTNWNWEVAKVQGDTIITIPDDGNNYSAYVMASSEWNNFTERIKLFLEYKKLSAGTFTMVSAGSNFTGAIVRQAIDNINRMLTSGYLYYSSDITAQIFTDMKNRLNSIT